MRLLADEQVFGTVGRARELVDDIPDVGADSEIARAPDIDRDTHRLALSRPCCGCPQGKGQSPSAACRAEIAPRIQRLRRECAAPGLRRDRKSTRLNSRHVEISY